MDISSKVTEITPFLVMEILEKAQKMEKAGEHVVHLEIGEPDFDTPECVKRAASRAMDQGQTHYTHSLGIIELREAICGWYDEKYGVSVHPDQVIVTQGTSPAMFLLFSSILSQGGECIVSDPCYACYSNFIRFAGARPVPVRVSEDDAFQYRPSMIREAISENTGAILVNSPSNPTGTLLSEERMKAIADMGPLVVSDEIYHGLVYEGREHSILEFTDNAVVLNGFSKLFAMTGWRLGYMIAPPDMVRPMQKACQNFFISANTMAQWAGVAALTRAGDDVERMKATYDERRRYLIGRLKDMGFSIPHDPTGAFYVLVNASHLNPDSLALAFDILEKARLGVTPGIDFGPGAEGYIRFSYANSLDNIKEGMDRLERYIDSTS